MQDCYELNDHNIEHIDADWELLHPSEERERVVRIDI